MYEIGFGSRSASASCRLIPLKVPACAVQIFRSRFPPWARAVRSSAMRTIRARPDQFPILHRCRAGPSTNRNMRRPRQFHPPRRRRRSQSMHRACAGCRDHLRPSGQTPLHRPAGRFHRARRAQSLALRQTQHHCPTIFPTMPYVRPAAHIRRHHNAPMARRSTSRRSVRCHRSGPHADGKQPVR